MNLLQATLVSASLELIPVELQPKIHLSGKNRQEYVKDCNISITVQLKNQ